MATKKTQAPPTVDMSALTAEHAAEGAIVNLDDLPTPVTSLEELFPDVTPLRTIDVSSKDLSPEEVLASAKEEVPVVPAEDGGYCNVIYHALTKRYLPFNPQLVGRADMQVQRVPKERYEELMKAMGFM